MTGAKPHLPPSSELVLSDLQLSLMRVFWSRPHASAAEVAAELRTTRPLAHTTVATLLFVPVVFSLCHHGRRPKPEEEIPDENRSVPELANI